MISDLIMIHERYSAGLIDLIAFIIDMPSLICPLCPYERTVQLKLDLKNFLKHIQLFHSHQPSFSLTCGLDGCLRTFTNFRVFRNHVSTFHSDNPFVSNEHSVAGTSDIGGADGGGPSDETGESSTGDDNNEQVCSLVMSPQELQKSTALFLLGIKEKYKLTQVAIQGIIEGVTGLFQSHHSSLYSRVSDELLHNGTSSDLVSSLETIFENGPFGDPFLGLETQYQQMKFYRSHFSFIVSYSLMERSLNCVRRTGLVEENFVCSSFHSHKVHHVHFPASLGLFSYRNLFGYHLVSVMCGKEVDLSESTPRRGMKLCIFQYWIHYRAI